MSDPDLAAVDAVDIAVLRRARLDRGKVGAGIGLGKDCRRQHGTRRDLRQPFPLLLLGAAGQNQLGRDLGAGAERANAEVPARQFLRHDAHGLLAETHAAEALRNRQGEHTQFPQIRDDVEWDQLVGEVPALRPSCDLAVGEPAHLVAYRSQLLVYARAADGDVVRAFQQCHQPGAALCIAGPGQHFERPGHPLRHRCCRQTEVGRPHEFARAHGNAALNLREIFAEPDLDGQFVDLGHWPDIVQPLGKGSDLADRLDVGGEPGKPMGGALLAVEQASDGVGLDADARTHRCGRVPQHLLGGQGRLAGKGQQLEPGVAPGGLRQHFWSPRNRPPDTGGSPGGSLRRQASDTMAGAPDIHRRRGEFP